METLPPRTKLFLAGAGFAGLALYLGVQVAQEAWLWPSLICGGLAILFAARTQQRPLGTLLLSLALFGYIVGNRGFAQVSLAGRLPLFMAEFTLLAGATILLANWARRKTELFSKEPLNLLILAWMLVCAFRVPFDLRQYGAMALRDFATVYYASFFFLAQAEGRDPHSRRLLAWSLLLATACLLLSYPLQQRFPEFFLGTLTFRSVPIIYYKDDLAGTFMAVGAVLAFLAYEKRGRLWLLVLSMALSGLMLTTNNRASMFGLVTATLLLAFGRRWRFAAWQSLAAITSALLILLAAYANNKPWQQTPVYGAYEGLHSLVDPLGQRDYSSENAFNKGDNNRFRTIWWELCLRRTWTESPVLGLGWGFDLSDEFARTYYPEGADDFNVRSPHNILVSVFSRSGLIGLIPFLLMLLLVLRRSMQDIRCGHMEAAGFWLSACVVAGSACFGVVLEGPMGALVFWTSLGLAQAAHNEHKEKLTLPESST